MLSIENTTALPLPGIVISDRIPAGFSYVADSATADDGSAITVSGTRSLSFSSFDLDPAERRTLRYLLRVGPATVHGEQINSAAPLLGPAPIGNTDTASVMVLADPDFEQTTVVGKVFNDRDGDGYSNDEEILAGTDPDDASDIPFVGEDTTAPTFTVPDDITIECDHEF